MSEKKSKKYLQVGNVSLWEHINLLQNWLQTTCDLVLELFSVPKIKAETLHVHCYGHALNLVVKDSCIKVKCLKDIWGCTRNITVG